MSEVIDWKALHPWQRDQLIAEKIMGVTNFRCAGKLSYGGNNTLWKHHYYTCQECGAKLTVTDYYLEGCAFPSEHTKPTPPYSTSMDAAWEVIKKIEEDDGELYTPFAYRLGVTYATRDGFDTFEMDLHELASLTSEKICIAALRVCDVQIKE